MPTIQTDATMVVVNCFAGQSKGYRKELIGRTGFLSDEIFFNKKLELAENVTKNLMAEN